MKQTARNAAVSALCKWEQQQGYSNIVLDRLLCSTELEAADAALATRLFYGVIERKITLDHMLGKYCRKPLARLDTSVRNILRTAAYQIYYMDKIPPAVAVHQAVLQCKQMGVASASGFANGVLRALLRDGTHLPEVWPQGAEGLSLQYSCPQEWISLWSDGYGEETALQYLRSLGQTPEQALRINTLVTDIEQVEQILQQQNVPCVRHGYLPACLILPNGASAKQLAKLPQNWYYYQDTASQWACRALQAQPGERIADLCAAPGGKTLTVAQYMQNQGQIYAFDLHEHKCRVLQQRAQQYGVTAAQVACRDAASPVPEQYKEYFDRVICDVPCSGLGVIRRKPEIRYKLPQEFDSLPAQQLNILLRAAEMVRVGGVLQYSTCTLHPRENEQVVQRFLQLCPHFAPRILPITPCFEQAGLQPSHSITLWPHLHQTDGFFIAAFTKERSA